MSFKKKPVEWREGKHLSLETKFLINFIVVFGGDEEEDTMARVS